MAKIRCKVCDSTFKDSIDALLTKGKPLATIAREHDVAPSTLRRHRDHHLFKGVPQVKMPALRMDNDLYIEAKPIRERDVMDMIEYLIDKAKFVIQKAEKRENFDVLLRGIREARGCTELWIRATALALEYRKTTSSKELLIEAVTEALAPYADAKEAVARAIFPE